MRFCWPSWSAGDCGLSCAPPTQTAGSLCWRPIAERYFCKPNSSFKLGVKPMRKTGVRITEKAGRQWRKTVSIATLLLFVAFSAGQVLADELKPATKKDIAGY